MKGTVGVIIAVLVVSRAHTHACVLPAVSFEEKIVIILFVSIPYAVVSAVVS